MVAMHSPVQRQALGGLGASGRPGAALQPRGPRAEWALQCLQCPAARTRPALRRAAWFTGSERLQTPLAHVVFRAGFRLGYRFICLSM